MGEGEQAQPGPGGAPNARQAADEIIKKDAANDTGGRPGKPPAGATKQVSLGGRSLTKPLAVGAAAVILVAVVVGVAVSSSGGKKASTSDPSSEPGSAGQAYTSETFAADTAKLVETGVLWTPTVVATPQSQIKLDFFTALDPALSGMSFKDGCVVNLSKQGAPTGTTPPNFQVATFMHAEFDNGSQANDFFTKFSTDVQHNLLGPDTQFNSLAGGKAFTATVAPPGKPVALLVGRIDESHAVFGTANARSPAQADITSFLNKLSVAIGALAEPNTATTPHSSGSTQSATPVSPSNVGVTTEVVGNGAGCDLNEIVHVTISDPKVVGQQAVLRITGPGGGDFPFTIPPGGKYDMPFTQSSDCQPASWNYSIASINGVALPGAVGPSPN